MRNEQFEKDKKWINEKMPQTQIEYIRWNNNVKNTRTR